MNNEIFSLIKENKFKKLEKLLLENDNIDLDVHDENNNYIINMLINLNQVELIKILLSKNIRLDILDIDGRTILYYPIKFNYIELLDLLFNYNKKIIGISIIDIKDNVGNTALHYATMLNNIIVVKKLIENNADPLIKNNDFLNVFELALKYNRNYIIEYLVDKNFNLNFFSESGESFLQLAIVYQNKKIIDLLIKKNKININNQEKDYGVTALHQLVIQNDVDLVEKIINSGADINLQDYYGNSSLIYVCDENSNNILEILLSYSDLNYDLVNIDGDTALHIILLKNINIEKKNLIKIIENTDLNIQNNNGKSCIHLLIENNLFLFYENILINKDLNIFINDNDGQTPYSLINNSANKEKYIKIVVESYYNFLIKHKNCLKIDWEVWCGNGLSDKIKTINNLKSNEDICKKKITEIVVNEQRSIPNIKKLNIQIDNGIFVNTCFYTGSTIDILFGILFLFKTFKSKGLSILLNCPLTENDLLISYYKSIGLDLNYKLDFINFEILWSFQKLIFPTNFENKMVKLIEFSNYIVIPLGIETSKGSHANILLYNVKKKILERFEPNGANEPKDLNYNSNILDQLILLKFKKIDDKITYIVPKNYLPTIGFQIIENIYNNKCKRIGDPNGFCGIWCIWWAYQRIANFNIEPSLLANELIKEMKYKNINFKNFIRNFSKNVTDLRDLYLKKYKLDINDWIVGNYSNNILKQIDIDICKDFTPLKI